MLWALASSFEMKIIPLLLALRFTFLGPATGFAKEVLGELTGYTSGWGRPNSVRFVLQIYIQCFVDTHRCGKYLSGRGSPRHSLPREPALF